MTEKYTFSREVRLVLCEEGDDRPVASWDLKLRFGFTPATPETGRYGAPENYDPGAGAELWIDSIMLHGQQIELGSPVAAWADNWTVLNRDALIQQGEEVADDSHAEF